MSLANHLRSNQWRFIWLLYRSEFLVLTGLTVAIGILDAATLIFFAPVLSAVLSPTQPATLPVFSGLIGNSQDQDMQLVRVVTVLFSAYLIKTLLQVVFTNLQVSRLSKLRFDTSFKTVERHAYSDYESRTRASAAELIRDANDAQIVIDKWVLPLTMIIKDFFMSLVVLFLLLLIDPKIMLILTGVFLLITGLVAKRIVSRSTRRGKEINAVESQRSKLIAELFYGLREVILVGSVSRYLIEFKFLIAKKFDLEKKSEIEADVRPIFVEFLVIFALTVGIIFSQVFSQSPRETLVLIGVFTFGIYRFLPGVLRILMNLQQIMLFKSRVKDLVLQLLSAVALNQHQAKSVLYVRNSRSPVKDQNNCIEVDSLTFKYATRQQPTLSDISFNLPYGSITGISGPSGGGKSTLLDLIIGLLRPTSGSIRMRRLNDGTQSTVALVSQNTFLIDGSIEENVIYGSERLCKSTHDLEKALASVGLLDSVKVLPDGFSTKVGDNGVQLSGGQRQRLALARAIYLEADLLILDEPTNSLDTDLESEFLKLLRSFTGLKTILIVSHNPRVLKECDQVIEILGARVASDDD
jgi:ABC-type bacteriocin/lantibiotic exporter with double-glycine peptidase domain